jgi:hypothetical protein
MSVPLDLSTEDLRNLASALEAFAKAANNYNVMIGGYGDMNVTVVSGEDATVIKVAWDSDLQQYRIDDWIGS